MTAPDAGPYGPNTPRVRRFLQHAAALAPAEWDEAVRRYRDLSTSAPWVEADYHLGAAIETSGRVAARDALVPPVLRLAAARAGDEDAGAEALLGALLALVVADRLDADLFETLYAPFAPSIPLGWLDR
jgi:hypothetical protein